MDIESDFHALMGFAPLSWQKRLYREHFAGGAIAAAVGVPTGLGKTSVIALWLIARARGAALPRRLVYVVDRRAVVDQATDEAMKLRNALAGDERFLERIEESKRAQAKKTAAELKGLLGFKGEKRELPISTLRGQFVDNKEWRDDPASPAIIVGTVDMIGSRMLFEGNGVSRKMRPYHAGLLGVDALVVLDEATLVPEELRNAISPMRAVYGGAPIWALATARGTSGCRRRSLMKAGARAAPRQAAQWPRRRRLPPPRPAPCGLQAEAGQRLEKLAPQRRRN